MIVVMLMMLTVNTLLLGAAGQLLGGGGKPLRILAGGLLGALFTGMGLVPGFGFLNHIQWRICSLTLSALMAFGLNRQTIPKLLLFLLLHLSLGGVTGSKEKTISMLLGAAGIGFACLAVGKGKNLIPVKLTYQGKTVHLTALRDTGNTLLDPITGKPVLIVGADIAEKLTGLNRTELQDPVKTMGTLPGLRLIPYRTVGHTGFLLALQIPSVRIGNRQGSALVAFSPNILGNSYQALTGGTV